MASKREFHTAERYRDRMARHLGVDGFNVRSGSVVERGIASRAMYVIHTDTELSMHEIGRLFGTDSITALMQVSAVAQVIAHDPRHYAEQIMPLQGCLGRRRVPGRDPALDAGTKDLTACHQVGAES